MQLTTGNSKHTHNSNDGRIYRNNLTLDFFQNDACDRQNDDENVQLIPSVTGKAVKGLIINSIFMNTCVSSSNQYKNAWSRARAEYPQNTIAVHVINGSNWHQ